MIRKYFYQLSPLIGLMIFVQTSYAYITPISKHAVLSNITAHINTVPVSESQGMVLNALVTPWVLYPHIISRSNDRVLPASVVRARFASGLFLAQHFASEERDQFSHRQVIATLPDPKVQHLLSVATEIYTDSHLKAEAKEHLDFWMNVIGMQETAIGFDPHEVMRTLGTLFENREGEVTTIDLPVHEDIQHASYLLSDQYKDWYFNDEACNLRRLHVENSIRNIIRNYNRDHGTKLPIPTTITPEVIKNLPLPAVGKVALISEWNATK